MIVTNLYCSYILYTHLSPQMISLCKNSSGDQIFMSKLQLNSSIPNDDRERSLTNTSLVSFNPSNSLKSSLFRKVHFSHTPSSVTLYVSIITGFNSLFCHTVLYGEWVGFIYSTGTRRRGQDREREEKQCLCQTCTLCSTHCK